MPISEEKRKGQEDYAVAMAIMKEMKAKGIINKEDILLVEAKLGSSPAGFVIKHQRASHEGDAL